MSIFVLLVGALHAVPVFLAGAISGKPSTITVVALVMTIFAIATGQAQYLIVDLLAIGAMYFMCIRASRQQTGGTALPPPVQARSTPAAPPSTPHLPQKRNDLALYVLVGIAMALFIWFRWPRTPVVQPSVSPVAINVPAPPSPKTHSENVRAVPQQKAATSATPKLVAVQPARKPTPPVGQAETRIWRDDQTTLDKGCGPFFVTGDIDGYHGCRGRVLAAVAVAGPPPSLGYYPPELQESMYRACESYQFSADVAGHRKCMRDKAAGVRVTVGSSQ